MDILVATDDLDGRVEMRAALLLVLAAVALAALPPMNHFGGRVAWPRLLAGHPAFKAGSLKHPSLQHKGESTSRAEGNHNAELNRYKAPEKKGESAEEEMAERGGLYFSKLAEVG